MSPATTKAVLAQHAAPRTRTVDEHMFTVERRGFAAATFRLQLFTASGLRPVVVVTQTDREGASLVNAAESYAAAVWQQVCPDQSEPPIWIQRQLLSSGNHDRFALVTFAQATPFTLSGPTWSAITAAELTHLVGTAVDARRGGGYVPRPPEPDYEPRYRTVWTITLPRPHPFRADACMPAGIGWSRRLARQLAPRRQARACCWYHRGDWHRVCATAIRLVHRAQRDQVAACDIAEFVHEAAEAEGVTGWELDALDALVCPEDGIQLSMFAGDRRRSYINGQHKSQAMLDAGVRRTIVVDWITLPPLAE